VRYRPKSRAFRESFLFGMVATGLLAGCGGGSHALVPDAGPNTSNSANDSARSQPLSALVQSRAGITEYPLPMGDGQAPLNIAAGRDGNLWFIEDISFTQTQFVPRTIGKITTSGNITEFPASPALKAIGGLAAGPDGNFWFTEMSLKNRTIAKITAEGKISEYPLAATDPLAPCAVAAGPDGNLWFSAAAMIAKVTTRGAITAFPGAHALCGIAAGSDGNLWFPEATKYQLAIGRITPGGLVTHYPLPPNTSAYDVNSDITAGPDGNLWFTYTNRLFCSICGGNQVVASAIMMITPAGKAVAYPLAVKAAPVKIVAGPDGNLWFTEAAGIGKISTAGNVTEYPIATTGTSPNGIAVGPDGNLWITVDSYGNARAAIWKINPAKL
jgi:streptogramin lyase